MSTQKAQINMYVHNTQCKGSSLNSFFSSPLRTHKDIRLNRRKWFTAEACCDSDGSNGVWRVRMASSSIQIHKKSKSLCIQFSDGNAIWFSLRVVHRAYKFLLITLWHYTYSLNNWPTGGCEGEAPNGTSSSDTGASQVLTLNIECRQRRRRRRRCRRWDIDNGRCLANLNIVSVDDEMKT